MAILVEANEDTIAEAAAIIRAGGLVAFPTETVYGLGANALDPDAVRHIFAIKGRPAINPVIVHVASPGDLSSIALDSQKAQPLVSRFWPGPLTVVLPKKPAIPDIVTAGGPTVAVRMPAHPVALALIQKAGVPIAAPSANRSETVSPTQAVHVLESLGEAVDIILDGGHTRVGLESTVIDLTEDPPRLLRPGMVLPSEIEAAVGRPLARGVKASPLLRSPGQMARHYAPRTPLKVVRDLAAALQETIPPPFAVLAFGNDNIPVGVEITQTILMPADPRAYAAMLYDTLFDLDQAGLSLILVEAVPQGDEWLAIRDRLSHAASQ